MSWIQLRYQPQGLPTPSDSMDSREPHLLSPIEKVLTPSPPPPPTVSLSILPAALQRAPVSSVPQL